MLSRQPSRNWTRFPNLGRRRNWESSWRLGSHKLFEEAWRCRPNRRLYYPLLLGRRCAEAADFARPADFPDR